MSQSLLEKLGYRDEKNILIQGLPSSIEKQFMKLSFSKNVTPLLKTRKIDFALIFALNGNQLKGILNDVLPALHEAGQFWIASPKLSSKIVTDLHKSCHWEVLCDHGYEKTEETTLDSVWIANRFVFQGSVKEVELVAPKASKNTKKRETVTV